jgi:glycosyltransferase involved in cell wall biosynthesis
MADGDSLMTPPLVSIVIPCYNQGRFLRQAIDSCLGQTHRTIEVVVFDDGSTDDTAQIASEAAARDSRVRVMTSRNLGLGAARNRAMAACSGEYVNFLDADDWLRPDKLERQLSVLERTADIGVVLCDIEQVDEHGRPLGGPGVQLSRLMDPDGLFEALLETGLFPPHVPLVRRSLVERAGGFCEDRAVAGHADYLLWLTIAAQGARTAVLDDRLAVYRRTSASMSMDEAHMSASRVKALSKLAGMFPHRLAQGIVRLTAMADDLRFANDALRERLERSVDPRTAAELRRLRFIDSIVSGRDRPVFLWGTGAKGKDVLSQVRSLGIEPRAFVDSRPEAAGTVIDGVRVQAPESLLAVAAPRVVIASMYHTEIAARLAEMGLGDYLLAP